MHSNRRHEELMFDIISIKIGRTEDEAKTHISHGM